MKSVLRVMFSVLGSVVLSILASWALRRLLLWSTAGGEATDEKRWGPVLAVMPVFIGNQWLIGQPMRPDTSATPETAKSSQKRRWTRAP